MSFSRDQHYGRDALPAEDSGGEEQGNDPLDSAEEVDLQADEIDERLISEKLRRQVDFAQKLFDDRTLVPMPRPKVPEPRHRTFHIFWGVLLLLVVVFVRRLPRYPASQMPERVYEGDGLRYWETKQLLGSNMNVGLLKRLHEDPEASKYFQEFSQLAKESADRRDKHEQRMHAFQKQLIESLNPLLILRDRISALLDQLPPRTEKEPLNAGDLRTRLQELNTSVEEAFELKESFLRERIAGKGGDDLHPDPAVGKQLRRVMELEVAGMARAAALLDFHVTQAVKAKQGRARRLKVVRKEMIALQTKVQNAAAEVTKAVAHCMEVLPKQHHWMLLLFVDRLPQPADESGGKEEEKAAKPETS